MIATAVGLTAPTAVSSAAMPNMIHGMAAMRPRTARTARRTSQPVDGAVVLRLGKKERDAHQRQEQFGAKTGHDRLSLHPGDQGADKESAGESDGAHVDGQDESDDEHRYQGIDGNHMSGHDFPLDVRWPVASGAAKAPRQVRPGPVLCVQIREEGDRRSEIAKAEKRRT